MGFPDRWEDFSRTPRRPAALARRQCVGVRPVVLVGRVDDRREQRLRVSVVRLVEESPMPWLLALVDLRPRVCANVEACFLSRRRSCHNPDNCAVSRPSASVCAIRDVPCTWNLLGKDRNGTVARRCCLCCAIACGTEDCPSEGSSCHTLCKRMDARRYGNACDSPDVPENIVSKRRLAKAFLVRTNLRVCKF